MTTTNNNTTIFDNQQAQQNEQQDSQEEHKMVLIQGPQNQVQQFQSVTRPHNVYMNQIERQQKQLYHYVYDMLRPFHHNERLLQLPGGGSLTLTRAFSNICNITFPNDISAASAYCILATPFSDMQLIQVFVQSKANQQWYIWQTLRTSVLQQTFQQVRVKNAVLKVVPSSVPLNNNQMSGSITYALSANVPIFQGQTYDFTNMGGSIGQPIVEQSLQDGAIINIPYTNGQIIFDASGQSVDQFYYKSLLVHRSDSVPIVVQQYARLRLPTTQQYSADAPFTTQPTSFFTITRNVCTEVAGVLTLTTTIIPIGTLAHVIGSAAPYLFYWYMPDNLDVYPGDIITFQKGTLNGAQILIGSLVMLFEVSTGCSAQSTCGIVYLENVLPGTVVQCQLVMHLDFTPNQSTLQTLGQIPSLQIVHYDTYLTAILILRQLFIDGDISPVYNATIGVQQYEQQLAKVNDVTINAKASLKDMFMGLLGYAKPFLSQIFKAVSPIASEFLQDAVQQVTERVGRETKNYLGRGSVKQFSKNKDGVVYITPNTNTSNLDNIDTVADNLDLNNEDQMDQVVQDYLRDLQLGDTNVQWVTNMTEFYHMENQKAHQKALQSTSMSVSRTFKLMGGGRDKKKQQNNNATLNVQQSISDDSTSSDDVDNVLDNDALTARILQEQLHKKRKILKSHCVNQQSQQLTQNENTQSQQSKSTLGDYATSYINLYTQQHAFQGFGFAGVKKSVETANPSQTVSRIGLLVSNITPQQQNVQQNVHLQETALTMFQNQISQDVISNILKSGIFVTQDQIAQKGIELQSIHKDKNIQHELQQVTKDMQLPQLKSVGNVDAASKITNQTKKRSIHVTNAPTVSITQILGTEPNIQTIEQVNVPVYEDNLLDKGNDVVLVYAHIRELAHLVGFKAYDLISIYGMPLDHSTQEMTLQYYITKLYFSGDVIVNQCLRLGYGTPFINNIIQQEEERRFIEILYTNMWPTQWINGEYMMTFLQFWMHIV